MNKDTVIDKFDVSKIQILSVRVLNANLDNQIRLRDPKVDIKGFNFGWEIHDGVAIASSLIQLILKIDIKAIGEGKKELHLKGHFELEFIYKIGNLTEFIISDKKKPIAFHEVISSTLLGISYSTARGIILTRCNGTSLEGAFLPIISPKQIIEDAYKK